MKSQHTLVAEDLKTLSDFRADEAIQWICSSQLIFVSKNVGEGKVARLLLDDVLNEQFP